MKRFGTITTIAMALGLGITGFSATASAASNCPHQNLTHASTQNQWVQNMPQLQQLQQMPQFKQLQQQFPQLQQLQQQFPQFTQQLKQQQSNCPWKVNIQAMMPQTAPQQPQQTVAQPVQQQAPVTAPTQSAPVSQPAQTAPAKQVDNQADASSYAKQVADLVNQERAKAGLSPLQFDAALSKVALAKANDMSQNHYFDHTSPTYGTPFDMMKQFGISFMTAGENIAMGQRSPQEVMTQWMNSAGHRQNIMNGSFTKIGVGYVNGYWVQEFIG